MDLLAERVAAEGDSDGVREFLNRYVGQAYYSDLVQKLKTLLIIRSLMQKPER